jgi:FkbM family methyltransferase
MSSHSQHGQDKVYIEKYMPTGKKGYFIEMGAADGVANSNTLVLEKKYGWNGVCIEADDKVFPSLQKNRKCTVINAACSAYPGESLDFVYSNQFSGFMKFSKLHRKNLKRKHASGSFNTKTSCTLTEVLKQVSAPSLIDFFSLDVEGAELEVLQGLDFYKYKINCILVEHNNEQPKRYHIRKLLEAKGYLRDMCVGLDDFYKLQ